MSQALAGKVAIVTGGSRGIGEAIAHRLAAAGAAVAVTYNVSATRADLLVKSIETDGGRAIAIKVDVADRNAVREAVAHVARVFGRLDILVNNAGVGASGPIDQVTDEGYDKELAINLHSVFFASQEALRHMGDGGRVINIGSINADRIHFDGGTAYAMANAGIAGFSRALAREVSDRGITVNTVQPGPTHTEMNPADGPFARITLPRIALGRYGTTDEVGSLVAYLAGTDAAFITGATINVDGGYSL
jgi:3-oxoacyl-[acyl-carrier protein] reductase